MAVLTRFCLDVQLTLSILAEFHWRRHAVSSRITLDASRCQLFQDNSCHPAGPLMRYTRHRLQRRISRHFISASVAVRASSPRIELRAQISRYPRPLHTGHFGSHSSVMIRAASVINPIAIEHQMIVGSQSRKVIVDLRVRHSEDVKDRTIKFIGAICGI